MARGNGKIFFDAPNRGSKRLLSFLNDAPAANEVVIDKHSASIAALHVGDRVGVLTPDGATQMAIAGIATYGGHADAAGAQVAAFAPDTAARLFGRPDAYDSIQVAAAKGTTPQQLTQSLQSAFAQAHAQHVEVVTVKKDDAPVIRKVECLTARRLRKTAHGDEKADGHWRPSA